MYKYNPLIDQPVVASRLLILLNYLQECNVLNIDIATKNKCAEALADRHAYAIFYQKNECFADIVLRQLYHRMVLIDLFPGQMDNETLFAIINDKGEFQMVFAFQLNNNIDQNILSDLGVVVKIVSPKINAKRILSRTFMDTIMITINNYPGLNISYDLVYASDDAEDLVYHMQKGKHCYIIYEKFFEGISTKKVISDTMINMEGLLQLQGKCTTSIFLLTYDGNGQIYLLERKNLFKPLEVEVRCNSIYRRPSDCPSLKQHSKLIVTTNDY